MGGQGQEGTGVRAQLNDAGGEGDLLLDTKLWMVCPPS